MKTSQTRNFAKTTVGYAVFLLALFAGLLTYRMWHPPENSFLENLPTQVFVRPVHLPTAPVKSANNAADFVRLAPCDYPNPAREYKYPKNSRAIKGGVLNKKLECGVLPEYPAQALEKNISGKVVLDVLVDETGEIVRAKVKSGHSLFRQAALKAAFQTRTSPMLLGGESVKMNGNLIYQFDAKGVSFTFLSADDHSSKKMPF